MKKSFVILALFLVGCLNAFSQATSLTVDCQNPGWLASYIGPENLSSIRSLTVTGQINGTDLATIGNLVKNYNLQGHLDMSDVSIVEDKLAGDMFGVTDCKLDYFALPKSIGKMEKCIEWVEIDTLVCGNVKQPNFRIGYSVAEGIYTDYCSNISSFNVKHLILREGIESIKLFCQEYGNSNVLKNNVLESILFPNSIKHLYYFYNLKNLSYMNVPEGVETLGLRLHTNIPILSDTLYIPSSVKTFYDTWAGYDYKNAYIDPNTRNPDGRIKCLYLPENLKTLWVDALINGTQVDIHIKAKNPPKIENGLFNSNTIVYVPVGYKDVYKATGNSGSGGRAQWGGATILEEVYAENIDINVPEILYVGDSQVLKTDFTPSNTTFKDVTWRVSDSEILSLTQDGTCTALSYGIVQVTAINADRSCTDTKTIKVYEHTTGVNISKSLLNLKIGEKETLFANTLPLETSNGMITWNTDDERVAIVDNDGNVKGIGNGTCTITATSIDGGYTAECVVTVLQPVETVTLNRHFVGIRVGKTETLTAIVLPTAAENKDIIWTSSDETIATVDDQGVVTGINDGVVWITATSEDNNEAFDKCEVVVSQSDFYVVSISTSNISTYCNTFPLDFSSITNLKAYIASGFSPSKGEVLLTRVYKVPAGEGLFLKGNAGDYEVPYTETDMFYSNLLRGVTRATTISPTEGSYTNFILANGSHGIGFYTLSQAGEIAAGKAYLQLPTSAISNGARSIKMRFDDEDSNQTAVSEVENQQPSESEYYDMQGRKVRSYATMKGMYIMRNANGSKQGKIVFIRR